MALVSVAEAARLVGRDRKVLYRDYLKTGRLSSSQDARGRMQIDTAELLRVFGQFKSENIETVKIETTPQKETIEKLHLEVEKLRSERDFLHEQLKAKDENLADLRQSLKLLKDMRKDQTEHRRWWWPFG